MTQTKLQQVNKYKSIIPKQTNQYQKNKQNMNKRWKFRMPYQVLNRKVTTTLKKNKNKTTTTKTYHRLSLLQNSSAETIFSTTIFFGLYILCFSTRINFPLHKLKTHDLLRKDFRHQKTKRRRNGGGLSFDWTTDRSHTGFVSSALHVNWWQCPVETF